MVIIDTNNESLKRQMEERRKELLEDIIKKGHYDTTDFYLVRTTDFLEYGHVIHPICDVPFFVKNNPIIRNVITDIFDEQDHIDFYKEQEKYMARDKIIKEEFLPLTTQYRSTVHFTLNGLVSSHSKGNFDDRSFIIIDAFKPHLENDDILSFRMEDTYIKGDVTLSENAIVMINKEKYQELLKNFPMIEEYDIVLFEGDEKEAVEMLLTDMGIVSEKIGTHGIDTDVQNFSLIQDYQRMLKNDFNIDSVPHWLSKSYASDDEKSIVLFNYYDKLFFDYFFSKINMNEYEKNMLVDRYVSRENEDLLEENLKQIILNIGLENFKTIINEFNSNILNSLKTGDYQVNSVLIEKLNKQNKKQV